MRVDVLTRLQHIGNLGTMWHPTSRTSIDIVGNTIHASTLGTGVVVVRQRCRRIVISDVSAQSGKLLLYRRQQPFGMLPLELFIFFASTAHLGTQPPLDILHLHIRDDDTGLCIDRMRM